MCLAGRIDHAPASPFASSARHRNRWVLPRGPRRVRELLEQVALDTEVIGIDEGQFFDAGLPAVCTELANAGRRVIVAGLDTDYLGKPFEPMPHLLAIAEYVTKTLAICMTCGGAAGHTQRLVPSRERVLVGATGTYEARCRRCFDPTLDRTP